MTDQSKSPNGGPAFPTPAPQHDANGMEVHPTLDGLSKRDFFAMQAMRALIPFSVSKGKASDGEVEVRFPDPNQKNDVLIEAYEWADAALRVRLVM